MSPSNLDPGQFLEQEDAAAVVAPARDLFSLLSRSLKLPPTIAALVTRKTGDRVLIRPGAEVAGDDATEVMFFQTAPLEFRLERSGVTSADRYLCDGAAAVSVTIIPERSEAESFRNAVLGSRRVVRMDAIAQHLEQEAGGALARFAEEHSADDLIDGRHATDAAVAVREALTTVCFQAGLTLTDDPSVSFDSEGGRAVRSKEAKVARRLDEQAAQAQLEDALSAARSKRVGELESTMDRLQSLAAESPGAALPDLLRTFSESERARLYTALFESQDVAPATRWLVAAVADELVFFAPGQLERPARRIRMSGEIGALRSIQVASLSGGEYRLLAGAARGVYELGPESSSAEVCYSAVGLGEVRGGVNAAAVSDEDVFATHSELGLLRWNRSAPQHCTPCCVDLTTNARAVRNVRIAGDRVFFSADDRIVSVALDDEHDRRMYTGSGAVITSLLTAGTDLFAGNARGEVLHWPDGSTGAPQVLHGGSRRPAESLALVSGGGVERLFYTDTTLAVFARVLGDTFTCRYHAGGQTLQRAEAAADLVVAMDDPRWSLLVWRSNQPDRPLANINIHNLTDHSIQDITLVPLGA
ncbi:MAG: hypothetical protein GY842_15550 [bacterium]|nr:hypothetical protein [bacterium]